MMTVILASGTPPSHDIPLGMLRKADRVVACDSAWRTAVALGRTPDAVVGDGDSLGKDDRRVISLCGIPLVLVDEQDTNDLCKAFDHALSAFPGADAGDIAILGATGRREDHSIGNIFHLIDFAARARRVSIVTDNGAFEPVLPPGREWETREGAPVSVFAPIPGTAISSGGLEWPLDGVALDALWKGTLNRTTGRSFSLRVSKPAIVYLPHA